MGAGIEVAWVDERHEVLALIVDTRDGVMSRLSRTRWPDLTASVCLRFVDPWGDAVFNQAQLPVLLSELRAEIAAAVHAESREHLSKVVRLIEQAQDQTHTYIKFIGD